MIGIVLWLIHLFCDKDYTNRKYIVYFIKCGFRALFKGMQDGNRKHANFLMDSYYFSSKTSAV